MARKSLRIKLISYDHRLLDESAKIMRKIQELKKILLISVLLIKLMQKY